MARTKDITKISDLIPDANNYNKGTEFGSSLIAKSIQRNGLGRSLLLDKNGKVIAGNKTLEGTVAAGFNDEDIIVVKTDGKKLVVVQRTDLDLDTKRGKEMALADNATAKANLAWDYEAMSADFESVELEAWGVFAEESEGGFGDNSLNSEAQEDDYEVPEVDTVKTDIVLGDLFEIGPHRLLCGDSTKADDVERLMGGEKADMVFTDPPYNIASDSNNFAADVSKSMGQLKDSEWDKSFNIEDGLSNLIGAVKKDFTAYIWTSHFLFQRILEIFKGFDYVQYLIWAKPNPMPSLSKRHPTWNTEMCVYVSNGAKRAVNFPEEGHFLSCRVVTKNSDGSHPTQKPILLVAPILSFSSNQGQLVLDLFLGSGTTMVAAHQLNRKCYGMELSEKYCQVIVDRMLKLDPIIEVKKNGQPYKRMAQ